MTKWLLGIVLVVLAVLGLWWQINTTKISYVNGLDRYAHLPNQEYVVVLDCYVFAWRSRDIDTAHPLLGVNAPGVAANTPALPREVTRENIDKDLPVVRVMDVVPKGTRFRVLSVRREESRRKGMFISYEITLLDDLTHPYQRIDLRPILLPVAQPGDAPLIDPAIAVPWIKR